MSKISELPVTAKLDGTELLPIVQGATTRRATLAAFRDMIVPFLQQWYKGDKGDPGADASNVGLFSQVPTLEVPPGTEAIRTSGFSALGQGAADYVYDPAIDAAYVAANPFTSTRSKNGRGFRLNEPFVMAAMVGVRTGVQTDQAPRLNAALALPSTVSVTLDNGVTWSEQSVVVPEGKDISGSGASILRALPTWKILRDNAGVLLDGNRASARSLTIDMAKVGMGQGGGARLNGVKVYDGARECVKRDLTIMNCTGYGNYDAGRDSRETPPQSLSDNVRTYNCQVHHEAQGVDGSVYFNCHAGDGDGDIGCASWYHPDVGSQNVRFIGCTGFGSSSAGFDMLGNVAKLKRISIIDCDIELTSNTVALSAPAWPGTGGGIDGLVVQGGRFKTSYIAAALNGTTGRLIGVRLEGVNALEATDTSLDCTGCEAIAGTDPTGTGVGRGVIQYTTAGGSHQIRWNGGAIKVTGPAETTTTLGAVRVSADTVQSPAPATAPTIKNRSRGIADFQQDGTSNCFANIFPVYASLAKCHLSLSIRSRVDGYIPATMAIGWAEVEPGFIRVRVTGANLATVTAGKPNHQLYWELTEVE